MYLSIIVLGTSSHLDLDFKILKFIRYSVRDMIKNGSLKKIQKSKKYSIRAMINFVTFKKNPKILKIL